ncbi:MAG TPA: class I SAM-dependent methyltransferase [bacterium]
MKDVETQAIEYHSRHVGLFERRYDVYRENPYGSVFSYGRMKIEQALEEMLRTRPAPQRILDAGCGTGFNLARFRAMGHRAVGLDASADMSARAKRAVPECPIFRGELGAIPCRDRSFDVVVSIEVIRYLDRLEPALREVWRVLDDGGVCFITAAPLMAASGYGLYNTLCSRIPGLPFPKLPQRFDTSLGLRRAFAAAGFSAISVTGRFFGPFIYLEKLAPTLLPGALRRWERTDDRVSDLPGLRDMATHLIVTARKGAEQERGV